MYKYLIDYLGGDTSIDKTDSKARAIKKIKEKLSIKPYLVARLKIYDDKFGNYRETIRYEMKVIRGRMGMRKTK